LIQRLAKVGNGLRWATDVPVQERSDRSDTPVLSLERSAIVMRREGTDALRAEAGRAAFGHKVEYARELENREGVAIHGEQSRDAASPIWHECRTGLERTGEAITAAPNVGAAVATRSGRPRPAAFASCRVHFALPALRRLLIVSVLAKIGKDSGFLDLLFEAFERALEILFVVNNDFGQT